MSIFNFKRIFQNLVNQAVNLDFHIFCLNLLISILKNILNQLFKIFLLTAPNIEEKIEILKHLSWRDNRILLILNQDIRWFIRILHIDFSWLIQIFLLDLIVRFCYLNDTNCKSVGDFFFLILRKCFSIKVYYLQSWFKFVYLLYTFIFIGQTLELKTKVFSIFRNA